MKLIHYYIIGILFLLFLPFAQPDGYAQKRKVMNRPYIDQRRFHYGFLAGFHMQDMELEMTGYKDEAGNEWVAELPNYEPGFSVGILGEMRLNKHLALRLIPTMHFGTKNVSFRNLGFNPENPNALSEENTAFSERQYQSIKSTYISIPVDLKFAGERFNNFRPYAMVGVNPMFDLTVKQQQQIRLNRFDCYLEAGFGCDFYSRWFKFIPEVKFCWGLANIINSKTDDINDPNIEIFRNSISKGKSKMIVFTFYFE